MADNNFRQQPITDDFAIDIIQMIQEDPELTRDLLPKIQRIFNNYQDQRMIDFAMNWICECYSVSKPQRSDILVVLSEANDTQTILLVLIPHIQKTVRLTVCIDLDCRFHVTEAKTEDA